MRLDYRAIRQCLSIADVLALIDYKPATIQRHQSRGPCPLCGRDSDDDLRCFSVHDRRNLFHCFRCRAAGNVLDLWIHLTGQPIRQATLDLCERLNIAPIYIQNPQLPNRP
jgi:DNA primase